MTHHTLALVALLAAGPGLAADKPAAPAPARGKKPILDSLKEYQRTTVAGFEVMIHNEVLAADAAEYQRKPLDVLDRELRTVERVLPARTVELLRRLTIWAEWDQTETVDNGRGGEPVAIYAGGWGNYNWGDKPDKVQLLKQKTITILSMKALTEEHQPERDSGRCVLLHELAHAVHDQLLGRNAPQIRAAYQQAMQKRLYDRDAYVTTNEAEFFAELTTAYYDQCRYFPSNRETLRKYDPVSHQMLEGVWGAPGKKPARKPDAAAAPAPDLGKLDQATFGDLLHGPPATTEELNGKVVLAFTWGRGDGPLLGRVSELVEELGPFGARAVAGKTDEEPVEKAAEFMARHKGEFSVVAQVALREKPLPAGRAAVFDPSGACVFEGSLFDALPKFRGAVGAALLAGAKKPKPFAPAVEQLTAGESPFLALPRLVALAKSPDADTAADAKAVLAALTAPGQERLDEAKAAEKSEPLRAFLIAEKVADRYKGSALGPKAADLVLRLRSAPSVARELKARKEFSKVEQYDKLLMGQDQSYNPADSGFQERNRLALAQLKQIVVQMKAKYPGLPATVEAERVAKAFGQEFD